MLKYVFILNFTFIKIKFIFMKKIALVLGFFVFSFTGFGQNTKEQDVKLLINTMDMVKGAKKGVEMMFEQMGKMGIDNEAIKAVTENINYDELVDLYLPIYDKNFTHEEIKALIAFYNTPIGKKYIEKQPIIMEEGMKAGQAWGMKLAQKIMEKK